LRTVKLNIHLFVNHMVAYGMVGYSWNVHSSNQRRWAPIVGLLILAPISAEYLSGYLGQRLSDLPEIVFGLLILGPLYGAPALLIREVVRRTGRGWPAMLALATAFGVIQAAIIDMSLFDPHYFDDSEFWQRLPAPVPGTGLDASQILTFVVGHTIWSFCAPIALIESLNPRRARTPWLNVWGAGLLLIGYLLAATFIHVDDSDYTLSGWQLLGSVAVVAGLFAVGWLAPRPGRRSGGSVPGIGWTGVVALMLISVYAIAAAPEPGWFAWPSVGIAILLLIAMGALLSRWSSRPGWTPRHLAIVAATPLVAYSLQAFLLPPDGDPVAKYATNVVQLLAVLALGWWAVRRADADVVIADTGAGR